MKRRYYIPLITFLILLFVFVLVKHFAEEIDTCTLVASAPVEQTSDEVVIDGEVANPILSGEELINNHIQEICEIYNIEPALVQSIIYHESRYNADARNNNCVGLMQINKPYHIYRAEKLGIVDFYDPHSNILLGVDYLSELFNVYGDPVLVLMVYNMGDSRAITLYKQGIINEYARKVLAREKEIKQTF